MKHVHALEAALVDIQQRQGDAVPMPESVRELHRELRDALRRWSDDGLIENGPEDAFRLIKRSSDGDGAVALEVGSPNFHQDPTLPHFRRDDGAWFDFRLVVRERRGRPLELVAYGFEVRFPVHFGGPAWVRFDLNPPGHHNDDRGLRCHVHPFTNDWSVPAPVLTPLELLHLVVVGLRPRTAGLFRAPVEPS